MVLLSGEYPVCYPSTDPTAVTKIRKALFFSQSDGCCCELALYLTLFGHVLHR